MRGVFAAKTAVFVELKLPGGILAVFVGFVIPLLALAAGQRHDLAHCPLRL
jgi:hypothetical protein